MAWTSSAVWRFFFVLMNHVNMRLVIADIPYAEHLPHQLVSSLVWNGQRGVQIFFAILRVPDYHHHAASLGLPLQYQAFAAST